MHELRKVAYIATSIDGYIAKEDGGLDWLMEIPNPNADDFGFADFMKQIDGVIMGRNTFETVLSFDEWPYTKPVFILSNSLQEVPETIDSKASIVRGDLNEILQSLKTRGFQNLYIDGGKTIQSFLKEDLIDELIITTIPIILGKGIPLFTQQDHEVRFTLNSSTVYNNSLVKNHFIRTKS